MNNRQQIIYIFGNPDLQMDSLPIKLMPKLSEAFPSIHFELKDPNEEWDVPEELTAIDAVVGLEKVTVFTDLESFDSTPRLTMHDFDALANLKYLKKLGKLKRITIIGVPVEMGEEEAIESVSERIRGSVITTSD